MTGILFVCLGNICRSVMAECIFTDIARKRGILAEFALDSAATSREELGNPIYRPAERKLREKGVPVLPHRARQMTAADGRRFDLLIGMDDANVRAMRRIVGEANAHKVRRLLDCTGRPGEVADPWYTGDFERAYRDIDEGCRALLDALTENLFSC